MAGKEYKIMTPFRDFEVGQPDIQETKIPRGMKLEALIKYGYLKKATTKQSTVKK